MVTIEQSDQCETALFLAECIARHAHYGQVDKGGQPYIGHCERVVEYTLEADPGDAEAATVGWLHDVVEDSPYGVEQLAIFGVFSEPVLAAVAAMTCNAEQNRSDYYRQVRANSIALKVKQADIHDNSDPERRKLLDIKTQERLDRKYKKALRELGLA